MKKLVFILPIILLLTGCSAKLGFWINPENMNQEMAEIENTVKDIAQELGISAKIKAGKEKFINMEYEEFKIEWYKFSYDEYLSEDYENLYNVFFDRTVYMPVDWIEESMAWYIKDDNLCKMHILLNASEEEIINNNLENNTYTINVFCGRNAKAAESAWWKKLVDGQEGTIRELESILGWKILEEDYKDYYRYSAKEEGNYFSINIDGDEGWWLMAVTEIGNIYEKLWEGDEIMYHDCERIAKYYPVIFQQETWLLSYCKHTIVDLKMDHLTQEEMCDYGYIQKIIFTDYDTREYISEMNREIAKSQKNWIGLLRYVFEKTEWDQNDERYFAIVEIHKDTKDSPEREIIIRRYKVTMWLDFYEYDVVSDTSNALSIEPTLVEEFMENCPKG